jgi:HNH endonuclease
VAVSKRLRYEVFRRDNHACRYCGATAPDVKLTIDHVTPKALGGSDTDPANLVTACEPCNAGKTSTNPDAPLVDDVAQDALRWSRAIARAAQEILTDSGEITAAHRQFASTWDAWTYGEDDGSRHLIPKDPGWKQTVDSLLAAGLPMAMLDECVQIAMSRRNVAPENTFRYMCGVAWNKVTEIQDRARLLVDDPPPGATGTAGDTPSSDFTDLEERFLVILNELLGDAGRQALKAARTTLYEFCGADFTRQRFLIVTMDHLDRELRYPAARAWIDQLPGQESTEWINYARVLNTWSYIDDHGLAVLAHEVARVIADGNYYRSMCKGTGEFIPACPARGTYYARLAERECCGPDRAADHKGHLVCERHLEQLMDGTFAARDGEICSASDFTELTSEPVPF